MKWKSRTNIASIFLFLYLSMQTKYIAVVFSAEHSMFVLLSVYCMMNLFHGMLLSDFVSQSNLQSMDDRHFDDSAAL